MGGMLSPALVGCVAALGDPGTTLRQKDGRGSDGGGGGEVGGQNDDLELMYDPQLNCFYDPTTYKYYELIQP